MCQAGIGVVDNRAEGWPKQHAHMQLQRHSHRQKHVRATPAYQLCTCEHQQALSAEATRIVKHAHMQTCRGIVHLHHSINHAHENISKNPAPGTLTVKQAQASICVLLLAGIHMAARNPDTPAAAVWLLRSSARSRVPRGAAPQKFTSAVALPTQYFCTAVAHSFDSYVPATHVHTWEGPWVASVLGSCLLLLAEACADTSRPAPTKQSATSSCISLLMAIETFMRPIAQQDHAAGKWRETVSMCQAR
jgi:hypothetical protein